MSSLKRDSNTSVFPWKLLNVFEQLFHRTILAAASEVFCKDFLNISSKSASFGILEDYAVASFFNHNCILVCEISFSDQWDTLN